MKKRGAIYSLFALAFSLISVFLIFSSNTSFSFKGFLEQLSQIQFKNSWLFILKNLSTSLKKIIDPYPADYQWEFGNWNNFTAFWQALGNLFSGVGGFILNAISGLITLFSEFVENIVIILQLLLDNGVNIG